MEIGFDIAFSFYMMEKDIIFFVVVWNEFFSFSLLFAFPPSSSKVFAAVGDIREKTLNGYQNNNNIKVKRILIYSPNVLFWVVKP